MKISKKIKLIFKILNQFNYTMFIKKFTKYSLYTMGTQGQKYIYYLINWKVRNFFAFANIFLRKTKEFKK